MKFVPILFILVATSACAQQYDRRDDGLRQDGYDRYSRDRDRDRDYERGSRSDRRYRDDVQLTCYGTAEKTTLETRSGYQWNADKHKYEPKSELYNGRQDFDTAVHVSIHDDQGHIRIPKQLIPPLNSGGSDGWWTIEDMIVGHDEIRGRFRLNGFNRPTMTIDRRSGTIVVDGMITFNGRCEQDSGHRRF